MAVMVEEEENEEIPDLSQNTNIESSHENMQSPNKFIAPHIHLFKTNRVGEMSQNDLLPRDYKPAKKILPHPIALPPGLIPGDGETTAEMLLKVSLTGIIRDCPEITIE